MTKIIYKTGDLLDAEEYIIVHGCNAQGKMNSGVAKAIRAKFAGNYEWYCKFLDLCDSNDMDPMGNISWFVGLYEKPGEKMIANMITQRYYGRDPDEMYVDYDAIRKGFSQINRKAGLYTKEPHFVAMPKIGAGLGGGDWKIISKIIEEEATDFQPVVYIQ